MVEINNQRKAFLDMLAWSEGTDNGRQKTRNHGYDVIVGGELFIIISDHPRKLVTLNPKLKSTGAGRSASFRWWMPTVSSWAWKTFRKVRTLWHCRRLLSVSLPMIDRRISVRQSTCCSNIWLHCRALVMVSLEHKADSPIAKFKEAGGTVREIDVWAESPRLSPLCYPHHRLPVIILITADNANTHKIPARQKCQRTEAGERGNYWHAPPWCCCARCKIHEGVSDAKAENDALRDDVAAGRRRLHIKAVCQSVREATTASGVSIMQPPTGRHRWTGLFHPQREADHYAKTTGRTQKYINEQCR